MIPGKYDLQIYRGGQFGPLRLTLPSLVPFGGPANLSTATVVAQIRSDPDSRIMAEFEVDITDPVERRVELTLPGAETAQIERDGVWDIEVRQPSLGGPWTPLAGKATLVRDVTR